MLTLIEHGEVLAPTPRGQQSVLVMGVTIATIGEVARAVLDSLGCPYTVIDATGCWVTPGFIDPHEHLIGGSGERGFRSQTPEITVSEIVTAGITTVVGCLGVDTTTKTLPALVAKVKGLRAEGLSAYLYTGGYTVPPTSLCSSVREDLLYLDEIIGVGEIAIADERSTEPQPQELARVVSEAYCGGLLSGKAGITHFHVGPSRQRLGLLRTLLEHYDVQPAWLYPTHIERSELLMQEAIALAQLGSVVDIDTVEEDLPQWLRYFCDHGGPLLQLTISSDAAIASPATLFAQVRSCVRDHGFTLPQVLPLVTSNTARVLKLPRKGQLAPGYDADLLVLAQGSLDVVHVMARGRQVVRDGCLNLQEDFLRDSTRRITLYGQKTTRQEIEPVSATGDAQRHPRV